jgi:hypothetical protein
MSAHPVTYFTPGQLEAQPGPGPPHIRGISRSLRRFLKINMQE